MKIPNKLKVGGITYNVVRGYKFKETELMGQCNHSQAQIRLSDTDPGGVQYNKQKQEECFVHEMLHAVDNVYNNSELDEKTISRLSQGLYQTIKDNDITNRGK